MFTTIEFSSTSWASDGDILTFSTVPGQGIWFGNGIVYGDNANWSISPNSIGNRITIRTALATTSPPSQEWSVYLYDGTHEADLYFFSDRVEYSYRNNMGQYQTASLPIDATSFHTYDILLKDGRVRYSVDGDNFFHGPSHVAGANPIFLVGDGSASSDSGDGHMRVDWVRFDTAPVPEPSACVVLATLLGYFGARRRR